MFLVCLGSLILARPAGAQVLRVAVAGNFAPTLERIAGDFEAQSGNTLSLSRGSTGKLYAQIRQGAPFDVFLAADAARPRALEEEGLIVADSRTTYAIGRLVVWAPSGGEDFVPEQVLRTEPAPRIALANPRVAPFGAAARAWLEKAGVWSRIRATALHGESVAQAFHFTSSGNAEFGFVALGQLRSLASIPGTFVILDPGTYPAIEQQAVALHDTPASEAFLTWLTSRKTQDRLVELGYGSP